MCLDAGECFFFFKTLSPLVLGFRSVKGFASFLSEMWSLFFRSNSRSASQVHRVHRSTREVWKARVWLVATHYIVSEITSWLRTSKYIVVTSLLKAIKSFDVYGVRSTLYTELQNPEYNQLEQKQSAGI